MSIALGVPYSDHPYRPALQRSRSHSTPARKPKSEDEPSSIPAERPQRPTHGRSQSYLSPASPKPQKANTAPVEERAEKHHRIHLPGKHHLLREDHKRHRYTQSEVQHHRLRRSHADTDSLPNLVAGLKREGEKKGPPNLAVHERYQHGGPGAEMLSAVPGGLTRMMSTRSSRGHAGGADGTSPGHPNEIVSTRYDLRRRATSDPRQPQTQIGPAGAVKKKSPIEADLERADRLRRQRKFTITKADVVRKDKEIEEAEEELRGRLSSVNADGMSLTRRLDYGYYNLLEKVGNLIGTIQSFQSLTEQSSQLVKNFNHETERLGGDMQRRIGHFSHNFEERQERVVRLETRGKMLSHKAEDLGRRLENARTLVENWEKKEDKAQKVWGRFWGGMCWTCITVTLLILAIVLAKEWYFQGDPVKAALGVPPGGSHNASLSLGEGKAGEVRLAEAHIPEDVRDVLQSIAERNRRRKDFVVKPVPLSDHEEEGKDPIVDDKKMRVLDEL